MYRLIFITVTIGGFVFGGSVNENPKSMQKYAVVENQYCWAEDTSKDDIKLEGRRRGKGNKRRRRGGSGLR